MSSVSASAFYGAVAGGVATGAIVPGGFPSGSMPSFLGGLGVVDPAGLRLSIGAITSGSKAVDALASQLGFTAPPADLMVAPALTGWLNLRTGQSFIAPSTGWKAPSQDWLPVLKVDPSWIQALLPKGDPPQSGSDPAGIPKPVDVNPPSGDGADEEHPDKPLPPPPGKPADAPWSFARELTDGEHESLREALSVLREGRDELLDRANELGFKRGEGPAAQVITGWLNAKTGEAFVAPDAGWMPPNDAWQRIAKLQTGLIPPPVNPPQKPPIPPMHDNSNPVDGSPGIDPAGRPEPPDKPWSFARELIEDELKAFHDALDLLREGREAVMAKAADLGFKPPAADSAGVHVLVGWMNAATGEIFISPDAGWVPPDKAWTTIAKLALPPVSPPAGSGDKPPPIAVDPPRGDDSHVPPGDNPSKVPAEPTLDSAGRPIKPLLGQAIDAIHKIGNSLVAGVPVEGKLEFAGQANGATHVEYEWRIGDKVIEGATSLKLPMMPLLAGREVSVKVSVADTAGALDSLTRTLGNADMAKMAAGHMFHWSRKLGDDANSDTPTIKADPGKVIPPPVMDDIKSGGQWDVEGVDFDRFSVRASMQADARSGSAIDASDLLKALKLAHGRNPNDDPDGPGPERALAARPFQLIAADIDGNGVVDRNDAQELMREMGDSVAGAKQRWLFVPERAELSAVTRGAVKWAEPPAASTDAVAENWIGVMLGDIDGNWKADPSAAPY